LELLVRESEKTVMGRTEFKREDVERMADRLRSWALIRGETITGKPFVRLCGAVDQVQVHLPVSGKVSPNMETGVEGDSSDGGAIGVIAGVPFENVRELVESASHWYPGLDEHRWAEFRPTARNFTEGSVVLPRREATRADAACADRTPVLLPRSGVPAEAVPQ
jgi:hypothetical protein